ncbi:esterase [Arthrobacter sp. 24S4-2]|uniref:alpha/beta hydrolase n=1 Tax=Arthrobacter sp. 24S4-2 TaxID=2575374 RepID=UPI0010C79056|nr:alpha/beta hydrolase-fold protein [Arthrobacter sp. 24S4-2]QCO99564.1 esterase [Arthrobacter sp. 24S4-2]
MDSSILALNIVDGPLLFTVYALSAVSGVLLLLRRPRRLLSASVLTAATGALVGTATLLVTEILMHAFGGPLGWHVRAWVIAFFAGLGLCAVAFRKSGRRRKALACAAALSFAATATLGINAYYGLHPTVASFLGISLAPKINLDPVQPHTPSPHQVPLWQSWTPPDQLPEKGTTAQVDIPPTRSGFSSRPAGLYLPPAAQAPNPPALPLVVMMMGQPGDPDPQYVGSVLNNYAAQHQGLAPIVIVADQLGDPYTDNLCLDSPVHGKPETFINRDVVDWARSHLNIIDDRKSWTIAGYSHGGQCAISFAAKYPSIWGNVLDISGEEYPGAEEPETNLREIFGGNQAAYDAQKPVNIMKRQRYRDMDAIFTAATDDPAYRDAAGRVAAAASAAGMTVTYYEVPNGGHVIGALNGGLNKGFAVLYPRLGLSQPDGTG